MKKPTNDYEALVLALTLGITATDDDKARQCSEMAIEISNRLSDFDVARAKKEAVANTEEPN
jgi:hypothetical protein|tara:strand:- start:286 stop:471 length:186 start_codon:yes stop_codon:yes gene_type:complete